MGVAWLGLTVEEFFTMRIGHFFSALQYYNEGKNREIKVFASLMRRQTVDLLNIQIKKSERMKPEQLWKFPWEDEEEVEVEKMTDEQIKEYHERIIKELG